MAAENRSSMQDIPDRDAGASVSYYARAGALLLSYQEQLLALQEETVSIAVAETSLYRTGALAAMRMGAPLLAGHEAQLQRIAALTGAWFRLATEIQAALLNALTLSLTAPMQDMSRLAAAGEAGMDRRNQSVVINFPDRRAA